MGRDLFFKVADKHAGTLKLHESMLLLRSSRATALPQQIGWLPIGKRTEEKIAKLL